MALKASATVRNAMADAIETAIGTAPLLRLYTGSAPANAAAAATGTKVAEITLPSDWMAAASSGAKTMSGSWVDNSADATGTAGYYRIYDSTGTTCHLQGTVTGDGGGGDMEVDNPALVAGQQFTVVAYSWTMGNA